MAETKIEWTSERRADGSIIPGYTFNPWIGCTKISDACKFCYAASETFVRVERSKGRELWGDAGDRHITSDANWAKPLSWNIAAKKAGERRKVFCASLADVFEDRGELIGPRERLFELIGDTPYLDWLLLTKRPENLNEMLPWTGDHAGEYRNFFWPNVWIGTTIENQAMAEKRIPLLLNIPARVHFLSCEPLLGPIDFDAINLGCAYRPLYCACSAPCDHPKIDWVIVGGESGSNARPMHPAWAQSILTQCKRANVPYFMKQWGTYQPVTPLYKGRNDAAENGRCDLVSVSTTGYIYTEFDGQPGDMDTWLMESVGKKNAGCLLNGIEYKEFPRLEAA